MGYEVRVHLPADDPFTALMRILTPMLQREAAPLTLAKASCSEQPSSCCTLTGLRRWSPCGLTSRYWLCVQGRLGEYELP